MWGVIFFIIKKNYLKLENNDMIKIRIPYKCYNWSRKYKNNTFDIFSDINELLYHRIFCFNEIH